MADDSKDTKQDIKHKSDWLLWLIVGIFLLLSIVGMWSIDYFFSPEALAAHEVRDAAEN